jgi:3-methyladenine DNA glycosylase/8-oxoguanine DNA glycosylase
MARDGGRRAQGGFEVAEAAVQSPNLESDLARADPALGRVMSAVVARIGRQRISCSRAPPFMALVRAIVYQSISGQAAAAIFARLKENVGGTFTPAKILAMPLKSIMAAGLSKSKTAAIWSLAQWFTVNRRMAAGNRHPIISRLKLAHRCPPRVEFALKITPSPFLCMK